VSAAHGPAAPAVRWLDEVDSTNDLAREAAVGGAATGTWIVARSQRAGRGRQGRLWSSPPGNFYGSLVLRPDVELAAAATLSLVAALAIGETCQDLAGGRVTPRLKWPNDVLVEGAKLAGILLESELRPDGAVAFVILGVGVNLAHHPLGTPYPVTSLAALGCPAITPAAFLAALRPRLDVRLEAWTEGGFGVLRAAWLAMAGGLGEPVRLRVGQGEVRGRLHDVGADGTLQLARPDGRVERYSAGELSFG
jgi:BirA family biotin operon repressor/biotin-[acetyl-CoA-carboxylase] ligase